MDNYKTYITPHTPEVYDKEVENRRGELPNRIKIDFAEGLVVKHIDQSAYFVNFVYVDTAWDLPFPGEQNKLYIAKDTSSVYFWDADQGNYRTIGAGLTNTDGVSIESVNKSIRLRGFNDHYYKFVAATAETLAHYELVENDFKAGLEPRVGINAEGQLVLDWFEPAPVDVSALEDRVAAVEDAAKALRTDLNTLSANAVVDVTVNGVSIKEDGVVKLSIAGEQLGLVKSSNQENEVKVASDGTMSVNSLNINKLTQDEGDFIILDCGNATI